MNDLHYSRCDEESCNRAADLIEQADILLVAAGAGFSADSGLAVYKDIAKVPAYDEAGLDYQDLCDPYWLHEDPNLFYGFWGSCYNTYQNAKPHIGYSILKKWKDHRFTALRMSQASINATSFNYCYSQHLAAGLKNERNRANLNAFNPFFVYTSNVDGHFRGQFRRNELYEIHGCVEHWQCGGIGNSGQPCSQSTWSLRTGFTFDIDAKSMRFASSADKEPSLKCQKCSASARPNVLMFHDKTWLRDERAEATYIAWENAAETILQDNSDTSMVLLEIGCGTRVPSVRMECEMVVKDIHNRCVGSVARKCPIYLIRINPDFPGCDSDLASLYPESFVSIKSTGLKALKMIDSALISKYGFPPSAG